MAVTSPAEWGTSSLETLKDKQELARQRWGGQLGKGPLPRGNGRTEAPQSSSSPGRQVQPGYGGAGAAGCREVGEPGSEGPPSKHEDSVGLRRPLMALT